jgi:phosphodiesterase/alkaline phosphatase D-like protein
MTSNSAVLWTRTTGPATVTAEVAETENFENPLSLPPTSTSETNDFTLHLTTSGLKPGTKYYYRFKAGNETSPTGSFKTAYAPDQNAPVTLGFTGDADWKWKPYPLLNNLVKEKLDFFFFLGDLIYETTNLPGTTVAETLQDYRAKYRENREPRPNSDSKTVPMLDLYRLFGQYSVFDNHETGPSKTDKNAPPYNEGGAQVNGQYVNQSEGFKARIQAYREYQPVREEEVTGTADPRSDQTEKFYRAIPWGANVELIVLDDRSYRDIRLASSDDPKATSCDRTMLGAPQSKWLQDELLSTKQRRITWKVVVVSSPIQQLGKASQIGGDLDGTKSWAGGYSCERNKLLKFIDDNEINNVVFLTTDNHYTVINNLKYNTIPDEPKSALKPARNAFEILTGPIGASAGNPIGLKVDTKGLSIREADRKILAVWNGDQPNTDGQTKGLKQAGLDPIGLEADFPGLQAPSIKATGAQAGTVEPLDFASFNTYAYAVLAFSKDSLKVQVKGFPIVPDPATLQNTEAEKEYESRQAEEILSFEVLSQPQP